MRSWHKKITMAFKTQVNHDYKFRKLYHMHVQTAVTVHLCYVVMGNKHVQYHASKPTLDRIPGSTATMVDKDFMALVRTWTAGSFNTRVN